MLITSSGSTLLANEPTTAPGADEEGGWSGGREKASSCSQGHRPDSIIKRMEKKEGGSEGRREGGRARADYGGWLHHKDEAEVQEGSIGARVPVETARYDVGDRTALCNEVDAWAGGYILDVKINRSP